MFFRKNGKKEFEKNKVVPDFILPLYLNQRFVYDILAIKNNGFTEFFEIKDRSENNDNITSSISAGFGNNNEFSLIQANISGELETYSNTTLNNEKSYKKTHTPSSLFMQVYQYLKENKKIINLEKDNDIDNVTSGDFIELKSNIELNTIVDFFETFDKVIDITEAFSSFATIDSKKTVKKSPLSNMKKPVENTIKALVNEENNIKYGTCKLEEKQLVIKLNKNYFINSDYSEIKNGKFRIIGKVLEIIPEEQEILLNRENAVGLYDPNTFNAVKEAMGAIPNLKFKEFVDVVKGKTIVIMPIAIGI
jgi:hypothetical protein